MATAETNFALTFLQQLSARQQKYAADFVAPPSTLGPKPLILLPQMERPKRKRTASKDKETGVQIKFTSLKPPKIDTTLTAPPSQTFHALKTRLAEETNLNPLALRFLLKNKAISDSKSVHEVFGQVDTAQVTVMVMKGVGSSTTTTSTSSSASQEGEKMAVDNDQFWEGIRAVVVDKFKGSQDKEEVFKALQEGFREKFGGD